MGQILDLEKRSQALSLDKLLPYVGGGVFRLVRIAMIRALEIQSGRPSLIDHRHLSSDKPSTIALEEISQGKITYVHKESKNKKG